MVQSEVLRPGLDLQDDCSASEGLISEREEDNFLRGILEAGSVESETHQAQAGFIIKASLSVAFGWWAFCLIAVLTTRSKSVLASLVDATIDLMAQGVLLGSSRLSESGLLGGTYPVGAARLEPVGIIICTVLMVLASSAVVYNSAVTLLLNFPNGPGMDFTPVAQVMLVAVVVMKVVVWRVAKLEYDRSGNVSLEALASDNFHDILSNAAALLFASFTRLKQATWWTDPVGGMILSCYSLRSWCLTALEQVNMLVGKQADPEFISSVRELATAHHSDAELRNIRAYHFGLKLIVEIELVMDRQTSLQVSHDVGVSLQDRVERLEECERCFVHVNYKRREHDLHDTGLSVEAKTAVGPVRRRSPDVGLRLRTALSMRRTSSSFSADTVRKPSSGFSTSGRTSSSFSADTVRKFTRKPSFASEPGHSRFSTLRSSASDLSRDLSHRTSGQRLLAAETGDELPESRTLKECPEILLESGDHPALQTPAGPDRESSELRPPDLCSESVTLEGSEGSAPVADAFMSPL